jgi:hypothetical protein
MVRSALALWIAFLILLLDTGCAGLRFRSPVVGRGAELQYGPGRLTAGELQGELMSYADTFNSVVNDAWVRVVELNSGSDMDRMLAVRRAALTANLASISSAFSIASSPNPIVGLADMITMVTLQRQVLEMPESGRLFGEEGRALVVAVYTSQERAIWGVADDAMTPDQQSELRGLIAEWRRANPTATVVARVRLQDFARARHETPLAGSGGGSLLALVALDPFAGLDPVQRDLRKSRMLGERTFYYASRLPQLIRWQAEGLSEDLLHQPEFRQLLGSLNTTSASVSRLTTVAERLSGDVAAEREAMLNQFFEQLSVERAAAVEDVFKGLTGQREALLADLDTRQGELQGTLRELHETVRASDALANSVTAALKAGESLADRVTPPPGSPPATGDAFAEYRAAMVQTSDTADRLTVLVQNMDKLMEPSTVNQNASRAQAVAATLGLASEGVIDYAFHRLLVLVVVAPLMVALSVVLYRVASKRLGG